jgi:colanic acid/amylovoran biosynthesis glycosyltransferase
VRTQPVDIRPLVLHLAHDLGNLTDRWIDLQSRATVRYRSRLAGIRVASDAGARQPHWIVFDDQLDLRLAYLGMNKSGGLSTAWLARRFVRDRPRVVHLHYGPIAAQHRHFARALRRPFVAAFYGYDATMSRYTQNRLWRGRYRRLFRDASAILTEGPAMAARVEALGCPVEKLAVIRLPADAASLEGARKPKADDFLVAIAGRFAEKKGFDTAIRAFARSLKGRPGARLLIVGGGELEGEYRELVADEGIAEQVEWGGRLPFRRFMASLSRAHVGLYPSRPARSGDSEGGAPVTLIEAQWVGVPSLVSDHDDLSFVAAPSGSLVLPALALDEWADALLALYEDPARVERMSQAAEAFVRREHAPAQNARAREEVYDRAAR